MKLDLTGSDAFGGAIAPNALDDIAQALRRPFVELVDQIGRQQGANLDWWVTPVASRNTYTCALYLRLCRLVLARQLIEKGEAQEIVTDSPALAEIISSFAGSNVSVSVAGGVVRRKLGRVFGAIRRYAAACFHVVSQYVFFKLMVRNRAPLPVGPVVLVDTFLYGDSFVDGRLRDRHYPGMLDHVDDAERARIFFAPAYYGIRSYLGFFRKLRNAQANLILKEEVLRAGDYVHALAHPFRLRWPKGSFDFQGVDVGPLVRESFFESFASSAAVEGLLRYRFAKRLKEAGIRPTRIIDWFENQEIDHGANTGWRTFFPETPVIGYQGFLASRHYLCMFPTAREAELRVIPQRVAVIGRDLAGTAREFCPALDVDVAPAFRFESVWKKRDHEPDPAWFTVLVPLSIMRNESKAIIELAIGAARELAAQHGARPWRFWIKPHPSLRARDIDRLAAGLPAGFTIVGGGFDVLLDQVDALVGAASSTCVHAIVRGVPVAVVGRSGELTQNPIPAFVDTSLWAVCYASTELSTTLQRYSQSNHSAVAQRRERGKELCAGLFEPVTRESVRRFLGFS